MSLRPPPSAKPRPRLSRRAMVTKQKMASLAHAGGVSESVWDEMARKMDEAYAELARSDDELRRAYQALSAAHEQLKHTQQQLVQSEKLASLGRLVAGVAHELNNPISFIVGNAHAMKRYAGRIRRYLDAVHAPLSASELEALRRSLRMDKLLADIDPLVEGMLEGAERTVDIVGALKRFSTADRHESVDFNLDEVVRRAAQWVSRASRTRMRVAFALPVPLPVRGSPGQLHQVVVNLVQNAVDATAGAAQPQLAIAAVNDARNVILTFHDNGPGFAPEDLGRVFDPFFTTKPVGKGTGLGLAVVHGIVQAHQATMEVESTPGGGSTFRIYFPAIDAPVEETTRPDAVGAPIDGAGKRVLYVDDEEAIIFLMKRLLERQGFRVSGFTDPREAVATVRANPDQFDLAVTDFNMPGMSGLAVAGALREIRADLPVVLASGYITEELRQKAPAAGVRELIYKPNTVDDLCEAVARYANAQIRPAT